MKKILFGSLLFGALFTACSNDEDFNAGIANPQASDATVTQSFGNGSVTEVGVINLAEAEEEAVKVVDIKVPTMTSETAKLDSMYISFLEVEENNSVKIEENGLVSKNYLTKLVESVYGKRPVERSLTAVISAFLSDGNQSFLINSGDFTIKVIPPAPDIEIAYYLTGSINGWDNTDTTYKLTNSGGDPYENSVFTCRIPAPTDGSDVEFKMTPESGLGGDWSGCLAGGGADGTFVYNNAGGNLVIPAVEGAYFYDLTFNMLDLTWFATPLFINIERAYYFTGSINGWNNTDTTYKLTNDGRDPYENPKFTCRIPAPEDGSNVEFKMTPESGLGGDWSGCLAGGSSAGSFVYNNGGGNLVIQAVEGAKFYDLTFNMMDLTWSYQAITFNEYIYEAGVNNDWGSIEQPLYCANQDGIYTGFFYAQDADWSGGKGAFKFTGAFNTWDEGNFGTGTINEDGLSGTLINDGNSGNVLVEPGFYRADVDLSNMTYTMTRINSIFVVGSAVNNDWDTGVEMTYNIAERCWECTTTLNEGQIKFKGNGTWDNIDGNWGGTLDNVINGSNDNIDAPLTGKVTIKFYPRCDTKSYATVTAAE